MEAPRECGGDTCKVKLRQSILDLEGVVTICYNGQLELQLDQLVQTQHDVFEAVNQQQQQCYSKAEEERARGFSGGSGKAEGISWRQLCQPTCSHLFFRVVSG